MSQLKTMMEGDSAREKLGKVEDYCKKSGLSFERKDFTYKDRDSIEAYLIKLSRPNFSDINFYVTSEKELDIALGKNFSSLAGLDTLAGYVDLCNDIIEVQISGTSIFGTIDEARLLGANKKEILLIGAPNHPNIRIARESELSRELNSSSEDVWSIRLEGIKTSSAVEAESLIKKYCAQVFFKILEDLAIGLRLRRRIRKGYRSRVKMREMKESPPANVEMQYPNKHLAFIPVALYTAASDPFLPPSFQFLLRYQAIEFFMLRANRAEAFQSIKSVIDSSDFDTANTDQLTRLLKTIKKQWILPTTKEHEQLTTLMQNTSLLESLRSFLKSDIAVQEHVASTHKFTNSVIKIEFSNAELSKAVASRIYDIRNAIVHAKEDDNGQRNLLLIETSDEEVVDLDSVFLSFIAKESINLFGTEGEI